MSSRILILAELEFNNYYLLHYRLLRLLGQDVLVVTNHPMVELYVQTEFNHNCSLNPENYLRQTYDKVIIFSNGSETPLWKDFNRIVTKCAENISITYTVDDLITPHLDRVSHICKSPQSYYIGRFHPKYGKSEFANPFKMTKEEDRDKVIWLYASYLIHRPELLKTIHMLDTKELGCWCHPRLCHGDLLVWLTEHIDNYPIA